MKRVGIIAALAMLLVALSASAASAAVTPGTYNASFNDAAAPNGAHVSGRTAPTCTVTGLNVSCSSYQLAGVGNTNANANLSVNYSASVACRNGGGNLSDSQHQGSFTRDVPSGELSPKNGKMTVPALSATAPSPADFLAQQSCPNPNWIPELSSGITLESFEYTLTFVAPFTGNYITIAAP
jgi:hypothetical protein